jgi:hypothetical protein
LRKSLRLKAAMATFLPLIHARLALTATWFTLIIGLWALVQWLRNRPLDASWYGAAVIAQITILVQGLLGAWLYLGLRLEVPSQRPFMHILYGIVAVITLPAAWGYFGNLPEERVRSLAMAATCIFLWGILQRAASTALFTPPGL